MRKFNFQTVIISMLLVSFTLLSSCEAIAGIFKAGMWFGIIGVVVIIAIIFWLINKAGKK